MTIRFQYGKRRATDRTDVRTIVITLVGTMSGGKSLLRGDRGGGLTASGRADRCRFYITSRLSLSSSVPENSGNTGFPDKPRHTT